MRAALIICSILFCCLALKAEDRDIYNDEVIEETVADVAKTEVITGNYYSVGDVIISGKVEGSAYVIGTEIQIDGEITDNLVAIGGSVFITGNIGGNVHILAGQAIVQGNIGGDVSFIGANLLLPASGKIAGNLFMICGNAALEDLVEGYVTAIVASFTVSGTIQKNMRSFVDRLRLTSTAHILGTLNYRSRNHLIQDRGAQVVGGVHYHKTLLKDLQEFRFFKGVEVGSQVFHLFVKFFYTFIVGMLVIHLFPNRLQRALRSLRTHAGRSFVYGLLVLIALPLVTGILLITVVGAPFALTLLALNIISFYTVTVFPILWVTNRIFRFFRWKESTIWALATGQSIYYVLTLIPLLGALVACVAVIYGFGATLVAQSENGRKSEPTL